MPGSSRSGTADAGPKFVQSRSTQTTFFFRVTSIRCGPCALPPREQSIVFPFANRGEDLSQVDVTDMQGRNSVMGKSCRDSTRLWLRYLSIVPAFSFKPGRRENVDRNQIDAEDVVTLLESHPQ